MQVCPRLREQCVGGAEEDHTPTGMRVSLCRGRQTGRGSGELKARERGRRGGRPGQSRPPHTPPLRHPGLRISCAVAHLCREVSCLCQLWASGLQVGHCAGLCGPTEERGSWSGVPSALGAAENESRPCTRGRFLKQHVPVRRILAVWGDEAVTGPGLPLAGIRCRQWPRGTRRM